MNNEHKKEVKKSTKIIIAATIVLLTVAGFFGLNIYKTYLAANIIGNQKYIYVNTGMTYNGFLHNLSEKGILKNEVSFKEAADKMNLSENLKPGRYGIKQGMNNRTLINKLKAGNQDAVKLKFQNIRKKENFAAYLAKYVEADSLAFIKAFDSAALIEKHGFNKENIYTLFIPNTYELYWNTSPNDFFEKMIKEYDKFWNAERKQKASALNLSPIQVSILASIVDSEALYDKEMPTIAGLYLNRLKRGILLQADPTVIFANDDFTVKRVTNRLLSVESKYNTYKYAGLPPGPITMPSINAIDAVLNREVNNYIYMCAKEDFSGYHNFAENVAAHSINAKKYREALNKRKIFK
jgi:UPF0755 protein